MEFTPFPGIIKLEAIYTIDGQQVENVHYFRPESEVDLFALDDLCTGYMTWFTSNMKTNASQGVRLTKLIASDMTTQSGLGIEVAATAVCVGDKVGAVAPNNVTVCIKWLTGQRGRSYRGRTYHVGLMQGDITGNKISTATYTFLYEAYQELMSFTSGAHAYQMVIASRQLNGVKRNPGVATDVTALTINMTLDSQRRRLPERGR